MQLYANLSKSQRSNKVPMDKIQEAIKRARDTKSLEIGTDAIARTGDMFKSLFGDSKAVIVADVNTFAAAGEKTAKALADAGVQMQEPFIFDDPDLHAEWSYLLKVEEYLKASDVIAVAVGSGVVNDLTKLASEHLGRRYIIVGTAASMDGYTAYGASITKDGIKQTFDCKAPLGVVIEPEISAKAPKELSASGYADLIAKVPAAAEWMIADALEVEKIDEFAYSLLHDNLKDSLSKPEEVYQDDVDATKLLAEGLIMSGFAMQAMNSSRPASGIEHQFSHYWDMEGLCHEGKHVSHGFKVGVGTLVSTACLEFMLDYDIDSLDIDECVSKWPTWEQMQEDIRKVLEGKPEHIARALSESKNKYVNHESLREQIHLLKKVWPELRQRMKAQIYSFGHVYDCLKKVGAPYEPEMIGITRAKLMDTFIGIPYMRSRYTVIDLIHRCGLMDQVCSALFGPGGHWEVSE